MKKVGEILKDMGFNKDSSTETQKAFIKYLIRAANKNHQPLLELEASEPDEWQEFKTHGPAAQQLSFDFMKTEKPKVG